MSRARAVTLGLFCAAVIATAGGLIALVVNKRVETGTWAMPTGNDVVKVKRRLTGGEAKPSRILYLHRGAVELAGGEDDAPRRRSSIVGKSDRRVVMPGFSGGPRRWHQIVSCVKHMFSPFDVEVTDALPLSDDYVMVVVGGRPDDLGGDAHHGQEHKHEHVQGLAPFSAGHVIPKAVVFAFADVARNRPRAVCETIAMEVGHTFGLDHAHRCKDVMTYLGGCGKKSFTDHDSRCGEKKPRDCQNGAPTQNSYRRLLKVLGPRKR